MGKFATTVQEYICAVLSEQYPDTDWKTEYRIDGTPVDIGGKNDDQLYLIELEWRRADPADNAAKIFRHLSTDEIKAEEIAVFQIFTEYYELNRGGVSTKRKNSEFVGNVAAQTFDKLSYTPVDFDIAPPKQSMEWPETWEKSADKMISTIHDKIDG